jgi:hypothetical protein
VRIRIHFAAWVSPVLASLCLGAPPEGYENAPTVGDIPAKAKSVRLDDLPQRDQARVLELEQQCLPRFRSLWVTELSFVERLCELDPDQHRLQLNEFDKSLPLVLRRFALIQVWTGFRDRSTTRRTEPHRLIHAAVAAFVSKELRPEQAARYEREVAGRREFHKSVSIKAIVAALDEQLLLSSDQRRELVRTLEVHWMDVWDKAIPNSASGVGQLPGVPDQHVVPLLTAAQTHLWRDSRKHSFSIRLTIDLGKLPVLVDSLDGVPVGDDDGDQQRDEE